VYKAWNTNSKTVVNEDITLKSCIIKLFLYKGLIGDKADYHINVDITPRNDNMQIRVSDIRMTLSTYPEGKTYRPGDIKFLRDQNFGETYNGWNPGILPPVSSSQIISLTKGNHYSLVYSFWGHRHNMIKLDATVNINGETTTKALVFKKFTEVELLH